MTVVRKLKKQIAVEISTSEAEYCAIADVMQRPIYIRQLAQTFNENMAGIVIENDNMPSILMIKILGAMRRSKIIEIRHQYIRGKSRRIAYSSNKHHLRS